MIGRNGHRIEKVPSLFLKSHLYRRESQIHIIDLENKHDSSCLFSKCLKNYTKNAKNLRKNAIFTRPKPPKRVFPACNRPFSDSPPPPQKKCKKTPYLYKMIYNYSEIESMEISCDWI